MVKLDAGEDPTKRGEYGSQIASTIVVGKRYGKFFCGDVEKFLNHLIADTSRVFRQGRFDQLVGLLLFCRIVSIERINKDIRVEKTAIFHSAHLRKRFYRLEHNSRSS